MIVSLVKQDNPDYEALIENTVSWAQARQDIHLALVVGSRARLDHPADEWADRRALDGMAKAFPHYDEKGIRDSLFATIGLFHRLAVATAAHLHFPYPLATDESISTYGQTLLQEG
jgi:hypothetical protein